MADDDDDSKPTPFEKRLENLSVAQLKELHDVTGAVLQRKRADEKKTRRPSDMGSEEFEAWKDALLENA